MRFILDIILLGCLLYGLWFAASRFANADGTLWQKALAIGSHSATMLWTWFLSIAGVGLEAVPGVIDWFTSDQAVRDTVQGFLKPQFVPFYVIAISAVTAFARLRTMKAT